jgi:hypothetical protein
MTNHKQFSGFSEEISKIILYKNLSIFYSLFGKREAGACLWALLVLLFGNQKVFHIKAECVKRVVKTRALFVSDCLAGVMAFYEHFLGYSYLGIFAIFTHHP